ncbi:MAG: TauD/TfdA family dioxygenase, partial [Pseudomonadota bacterium]
MTRNTSADTNSTELFVCKPLAEKTFGAEVRFVSAQSLEAVVDALRADSGPLLDAFYAARGLLILKGMDGITANPQLLLTISQLFGDEVENYRRTLTPGHMIHPNVDEILLLSNLDPVDIKPPPKPQPERAADGSLPVQFPHRRGWHTDQSFRRPPPDVSLFYAVVPCPKDQGQTLFADGVAAYEALS